MDSLRRNNKVLVVMLLALVIVAIALSMAIFSYRQTGIRENKLSVGKLKLTLAEGNAINLTEAYPITDEEGGKLSGFTFTLTNNGTASASYSIYLDNVTVDSGETKLDDKYIKYSLTKDTVVGDANFLTNLGNNQQRVLDSGTINQGSSINYDLKLWVTSSISGDISGNVWKGKLRIEGEQVH